MPTSQPATLSRMVVGEPVKASACGSELLLADTAARAVKEAAPGDVVVDAAMAVPD